MNTKPQKGDWMHDPANAHLITKEQPEQPEQPSAEALHLAVKLSGHTHCQRALASGIRPGSEECNTPCDGCFGDAATIDESLQLPARNAALLLAQGVCDLHDPMRSRSRTKVVFTEAVAELREALKGIRT